MTILSTILGWWSGKRVPTVLQRQETFSSFRHLADKIPMSDVDGLEAALNNVVNEVNITGNTTLVLPAKTMLEKIFILPASTITLSIGTTNYGTDVVDNVEITASGELIGLDKYIHAGGTLYITGITASTFIKYFIRK